MSVAPGVRSRVINASLPAPISDLWRPPAHTSCKCVHCTFHLTLSPLNDASKRHQLLTQSYTSGKSRLFRKRVSLQLKDTCSVRTRGHFSYVRLRQRLAWYFLRAMLEKDWTNIEGKNNSAKSCVEFLANALITTVLVAEIISRNYSSCTACINSWSVLWMIAFLG